MHQYQLGYLAVWGLFAVIGIVTFVAVHVMLSIRRRKRDRLDQAENEKDMRRLDERLQQDSGAHRQLKVVTKE